jgi:hypothetical protein
MTTPEQILMPICVLAIWTFIVLTFIPYKRISATLAKRAHIKDFRYGESANVPGDVSLWNRDYMNLLELPVLFYVICLALYVTRRVDALHVQLAWGFVAARLAHSLIHLLYNNILHRFLAFGAATLLLLAMWVRFTLSLAA